MSARSAGLLLFRAGARGHEVMLVHMGGPFWQHRDEGAWTVPKGEFAPPEDALAAARREFAEELGLDAPAGEPLALGEVRQRGGKIVEAWALEADLDVERIRSNEFDLEWPRGSGRIRSFPEVDRAGWFTLAEARRKLLASQHPLLERLEEHLRRA